MQASVDWENGRKDKKRQPGLTFCDGQRPSFYAVEATRTAGSEAATAAAAAAKLKGAGLLSGRVAGVGVCEMMTASSSDSVVTSYRKQR